MTPHLASDPALSATLAADAAWPAWVVAGAATLVASLFWLRLRSVRRHAERLARSFLREPPRDASGPALADVSGDWPSELEAVAAAGRRAVAAGQERARALSARVLELEAILRSTTDGVLALDMRQRVLDLNPAAERLLGVVAGTARGRLLQESTRYPDLNRFVSKALLAETECEGDLRFEGNHPREIRAIGTPLRDAGGRMIGLLLSLQDITRLRRLESLRSEFVANVSHELRTPITAIKGYVETLLQVGTEDRVQLQRFLEIVQRNAQRLSALVEDLLDLASLEQAGADAKPRLEAASIDAALLVQEVREQLTPAAEARRVAIEAHVPAELRVVAHRLLVEQALMNLVSNAIRYSPEGGTVEISVRTRVDGPAQAFVEFAVRDCGPGIAPVHHERIFERFYRVDRARSRAQGGTGLGLAIVKHIAQLHGGRVELDSAIGEGSVFRFLVPHPAPVAQVSGKDVLTSR
jgi:two-component system phosphate regulon sensor histidine kinase PhoR